MISEPGNFYEIRPEIPGVILQRKDSLDSSPSMWASLTPLPQPQHNWCKFVHSYTSLWHLLWHPHCFAQPCVCVFSDLHSCHLWKGGTWYCLLSEFLVYSNQVLTDWWMDENIIQVELRSTHTHLHAVMCIIQIWVLYMPKGMRSTRSQKLSCLQSRKLIVSTHDYPHQALSVTCAVAADRSAHGWISSSVFSLGTYLLLLWLIFSGESYGSEWKMNCPWDIHHSKHGVKSTILV